MRCVRRILGIYFDLSYWKFDHIGLECQEQHSSDDNVADAVPRS